MTGKQKIWFLAIFLLTHLLALVKSLSNSTSLRTPRLSLGSNKPKLTMEESMELFLPQFTLLIRVRSERLHNFLNWQSEQHPIRKKTLTTNL